MTECERERIPDLCSTEAEDMTAMHDISDEKWLYKFARDQTSPHSTGDEAALSEYASSTQVSKVLAEKYTQLICSKRFIIQNLFLQQQVNAACDCKSGTLFFATQSKKEINLHNCDHSLDAGTEMNTKTKQKQKHPDTCLMYKIPT